MDSGLKITELFEIPVNRLLNEPFGDLLEVLDDKERYERVEARIRRENIKVVS